MALTAKKVCEIAQQYRERLETLCLLARGLLAQRIERIAQIVERLRNHRRLMEISLQRGWLKAADRVGQEAIDRFPMLRFDLEDFENDFTELEKPLPPLAEIMAELRQAEAEFGELKYDRQENYLSAVTEPITLEDIDLGAFEIRLFLDVRGADPGHEAYRVVAQDPHPAENDSSVTHPHVRGEILCAGQAADGIRQALLTGRLCDFFLLVRSVLRQYNAQSPHIALKHWGESTACFDCGVRIGSDSHCCATCENEFCADCISYCNACYEDICNNCRLECAGCEEYLCNNCATLCPHCKKTLCKECAKHQRCPCQKDPKPETNSKSEKERKNEQAQNPSIPPTAARSPRSRRRLPPLPVG